MRNKPIALTVLTTLLSLLILVSGCGPDKPVDPDGPDTVDGVEVHRWTPPEGETVPTPEVDTPVVVLETEKGEIALRLYPDRAPVTCENIMNLVKEGFYDGLTFHRVEGALIQGGDPNGDGTGGPGYTIPFEDSGVNHYVGAVGMARRTHPDTAGSQFYICKVELPSLNRQYCVFGQVIAGQDVVDAIEIGDVIEKAALTTYGDYAE
ncbi:MAG: hypothetical protein GF403_04685 [Candidatus Coatesbacteria bacterium]|nr:hypothetical protein [Candidatus Coatesbacteria bacterium]